MNIDSINTKGYNLSFIISSFSFIGVDTTTNTITFKRSKNSGLTSSTSNTSITIRKETDAKLNVNNKK